MLDEAAGQAADAIRMIIAEGADAAMNKYNAVKRKTAEKKAEKPKAAGENIEKQRREIAEKNTGKQNEEAGIEGNAIGKLKTETKVTGEMVPE